MVARQLISAEEEREAIAEVITELGTGELA